MFRRHLEFELKAIDDFLYRENIGVRYSYRQYVQLEARPRQSISPRFLESLARRSQTSGA